MSEHILAWHFTRDDGTTDNLQQKEEIGVTYTCAGKITPCINGFHASINPVDALQYAPGFWVRRVRCGGEIVQDTDKLACSERTVIAEADAKNVILLWAADCAERALMREREAGREPDQRSWAAIEVLRKFVTGEATQEEVETAAEAAWAAAEAAWAAEAAAWAAWAAWAAAWSAARSAASAAARSAAWSARSARSVAESAAWSAASSAAWSAARSAQCAEKQWQQEELTKRLLALLEREE